MVAEFVGERSGVTMKEREGGRLIVQNGKLFQEFE